MRPAPGTDRPGLTLVPSFQLTRLSRVVARVQLNPPDKHETKPFVHETTAGSGGAGISGAPREGESACQSDGAGVAPNFKL